MLNALRLNQGFSLARFVATTGLETAAIAPRLDAAYARGWLERDGDQVRTTEFGRRFLNDVIAAFLPEKPKVRVIHGGPPHD